MKPVLFCLSTLALLVASGITCAQIATFESGLDGFTEAFDPDTAVAQSSAASTEGNSSLVMINSSGGGTNGGAFRWTAQLNLNAEILSDCIAMDPDAVLSFDLIDVPGTHNWWNMEMAGNSELGGWTQSTASDVTPPATGVTVTKTWAEMGWSTGNAWYQLNLSTNYGDPSGADLRAYVDNVRIVSDVLSSDDCAYVALPVTTVLLGDVNLDEVVDFADIPPFITLLQSGGFQAEGDIDLSGLVDFDDIPAFIQVLSGQ